MDNKPPLIELHTKNIDECNAVLQDITLDLENYRFYLASEKLYHYFWHTFADVIIEESKEKMTTGTAEEKLSAQWTLFHILINSLKALHPFIPFVTEEIWSLLPIKDKKLLMVESWPVPQEK